MSLQKLSVVIVKTSPTVASEWICAWFHTCVGMCIDIQEYASMGLRPAAQQSPAGIAGRRGFEQNSPRSLCSSVSSVS